MAIKPCNDTSAAQWITSSKLPWDQLVAFGPEGFDHHARLRFIPDPTHPGQQEGDAGTGDQSLSETEKLSRVLDILRHHTQTPDQLFIAHWDGYGFEMPAARFEVPHRDYFLYSATSADTCTGEGAWEANREDQAPRQQWMPAPAFVWPADHAWCVAHDVDPHWAGIGASAEAIKELLAETRLDLVIANPADPQPAYY
ncbi:hypothetical protein ACX80D_04605 [Arthrobacter sp. Sr24]